MWLDDGYRGVAYVLYGGARRSGTGAIATASDLFTLSGDAEYDYLGDRVGAGGDLDGDGTEEIVVGAQSVYNTGTWSGAAYLLYGAATRRSGEATARTADAVIQGTGPSDYAGHDVAIVPDVDGAGSTSSSSACPARTIPRGPPGSSSGTRRPWPGEAEHQRETRDGQRIVVSGRTVIGCMERVGAIRECVTLDNHGEDPDVWLHSVATGLDEHLGTFTAFLDTLSARLEAGTDELA